MQKLQSTLTNMLLSLGCITIVAAAALAGTNILTKDTIAKAAAEKQTAAISAVLPQHDRIADAQEVNGMTIYRAYQGDQFVGAAVKAHDDNGFNGLIEVMVGFDANNTITEYVVLTQNETPGLGAKMSDWFRTKGNIKGKKATGNFTVTKDGGDIDAITAATISSRAFLRTVNAAYNALNNGAEVNAASGASQLSEPVAETTNEEKEANNE